MSKLRAPSWQVILADLALILFLTTLAGLVASGGGRSSPDALEVAVVSPSAVYRQVDGGTSLDEWLSMEKPDSRARLTIFAQYTAEGREQVWNQVQAMTQQASEVGYQPRIIFTSAQSNDVYASLAYDNLEDAPEEEQETERKTG